MEFHPVAESFPLMTDREFTDLCVDIAANDLREAIWTHDGMIIDGRNRFNACVKVGKEPKFRPYTGPVEKLTSFVVSLNLNRRHLNESQRAMVAARLANAKRGGDQSNTAIAVKVTQSKAAEMLNVSEDSISRAVKVQRQAIPEVQKLVDSGEMSVTKASAIAGMSKKKQHRIIKSGRDSGKKILNKLKAKALRRTADGFVSCLHCSPHAKFTSDAMSAFWQKIAFNAARYAKENGTTNYAPVFESMADEIAELEFKTSYLNHRDRILAIIDRGTFEGDIGVCEKTDLQRISGISWKEFDSIIATMLDYKLIEVFRQGRITPGQRGATKILYRRGPGIATENDSDEDGDGEIGSIYNPLDD